MKRPKLKGSLIKPKLKGDLFRKIVESDEKLEEISTSSKEDIEMVLEIKSEKDLLRAIEHKMYFKSETRNYKVIKIVEKSATKIMLRTEILNEDGSKKASANLNLGQLYKYFKEGRITV